MTWVKNWLKSIFTVFRFNPLTSYRFQEVDELPKRLKERQIYVEGDWTAAFLCPCGCNDKIELNLINDTYPCWQIVDNKIATISPSINKKDGCRSHFFIRKGEVVWV